MLLHLCIRKETKTPLFFMSKVNCPRCGGSGKTEHTHVVYGVCFLCKGNGIVSQSTIDMSEERKRLKFEAKRLQAKIERDEMVKRIKQIKEVQHKNYLTRVKIQNINSSISFYKEVLNRLAEQNKLETEQAEIFKNLLKNEELELNKEKLNIIE